MDVEAYLQRINYDGTLEPTPETLRRLHRAHMYAVPFENLDILLGRTITLSVPAFFEKIVRRRRGGFCYELNALFGWLLREIGFDLEMLSARVYSGGAPGPEFDHMLLLLETGESLVADVGFGDSFVEPVALSGQEQHQLGSAYRVVEHGDDRILQQRLAGADWQPQYQFSLKPRRLEEFAEMCHFQQTSADSHFTKKSVCTLATREGRITLSDARLIRTSNGDRQEEEVRSLREYRTLLAEHFGIDLGDQGDHVRLARLYRPARCRT